MLQRRTALQVLMAKACKSSLIHESADDSFHDQRMHVRCLLRAVHACKHGFAAGMQGIPRLCCHHLQHCVETC